MEGRQGRCRCGHDQSKYCIIYMGKIVKEQNYEEGALGKTVHIDVKINGWKETEFRKTSRTILQKRKLHSATTLEKTIHVSNG